MTWQTKMGLLTEIPVGLCSVPKVYYDVKRRKVVNPTGELTQYKGYKNSGWIVLHVPNNLDNKE